MREIVLMRSWPSKDHPFSHKTEIRRNPERVIYRLKAKEEVTYMFTLTHAGIEDKNQKTGSFIQAKEYYIYRKRRCVSYFRRIGCGGGPIRRNRHRTDKTISIGKPSITNTSLIDYHRKNFASYLSKILANYKIS